MFQSFGWQEIALILVIVLIVFGVGKLPQIGGAVGKSIREFRKARSGDDESTSKDKNTAKATETEVKDKS
jgi:sec-independent protein translocase protein TatA